jgi:hypothetical protein
MFLKRIGLAFILLALGATSLSLFTSQATGPSVTINIDVAANPTRYQPKHLRSCVRE